MTETIYMPLLDEGVEVWRPVPGWRVNDHIYIVLRPDDYVTENKRWKCPPGSTVECEKRNTADGEIFAAMRPHVTARRTA